MVRFLFLKVINGERVLSSGLEIKGREPMVSEPDVALSMTAFGFLANGDYLPDISSNWTPSRAMLSTFATNYASLKSCCIKSYKKRIAAESTTYFTVRKYCMALKEVHFDVCDFNGSL